MAITDLLNLRAKTVSDVAIIDCAQQSQLLARASYRPVGVNGGLAFSYNIVKALPQANTRNIGGKPTASTPTIEQKSALMRIFTSVIPVDSVFNTAQQDGKELHALASTSALAVANKIVKDTIDGDASKDATTFDGFAKLITGTATDLTMPPVDISIGCTDLTKAGTQLIQAISQARGKMGHYKPNMIICDTETKELMVAALKNTGHIRFATMEELGLTYDMYGNMDLVDTDLSDSLKADVDGLAYVYMVYWDAEKGVRYEVPAVEGGQGFIKQSMPSQGNNGACVAEGYTQGVAHLTVPSVQMVSRFKVRVEPQA